MSARSSSRAGFTLIEALVAITVLAVFVTVVGQGLVTARASSIATLNYAKAEAVARTLLEGPVPKALLRPGQLSGKLEGHTYLMVSRPLPFELPKPKREGGRRIEPSVVPLRITVSVAAGARRMVKVETVRLVPKRPPS